MLQIRKYPRTPHIEGSRLQPGDEGMGDVPFRVLAKRNIVVEEKVDGANSAVSFSAEGKLQLQSRGHYLTGGPREAHFAQFKTWAHCHQSSLRQVLADRYIMYGEWCYARHTIFYDQLPHYFLEFDVLDQRDERFLSTPERHQLLSTLPVSSVPVLFSGKLRKTEQLTELVTRSAFKSNDWRDRLIEVTTAQGLDLKRVLKETDPTMEMEGLYIKVEENGSVVERYKWVRASFLQAVVTSGSHWHDRPIIANQLSDGVDIYAYGVTP